MARLGSLSPKCAMAAYNIFFQLFQMNLLKNIPLVSVGGQRGRLSLRQHSGHFHAQLDGTRAEKGFFGYQKLHRRQVGDGRRKRKIGKFFSKKKKLQFCPLAC